MRTRVLVVGVALFVVGLAVGLSTPTTEAQAVADPCAAPWDVTHGMERPLVGGAFTGYGDGGFYGHRVYQDPVILRPAAVIANGNIGIA